MKVKIQSKYRALLVLFSSIFFTLYNVSLEMNLNIEIWSVRIHIASTCLGGIFGVIKIQRKKKGHAAAYMINKTVTP